MNYKFCIMAAGKGSRNKSIKGIHKALLPIENKTVISHIFDKIPKSIEIIIAVGYKSDQIKSYLNLVHSDRKIKFVDIENYDGEGSGPGLSLLMCEPYLQCPFIFTSVDTIVEESFGLEELSRNWIGYSDIKKNESFSYCLVEGEKYLDKFYYGYGDKAFIGMAGIYDYKIFWNELRVKSLIKNEHQVLNGFRKLENIELKYFTWHDTGNDNSYNQTRNRFCNDIVALKNDEALFIENGLVIKYFYNTKIVEQRLERIKHLNDTSPKVKKINDNMYYYPLIEGKTLSSINDENILNKVILYWYNNLGSFKFEKTEEFLNDCKIMYYNKTIERCNYFKDLPIDKLKYINGVEVDRIENMLEKLDWNFIYKNAIPSKFHGDYQPENIIYTNEENFKLIDWRQSFGNSVSIGDFYYDLGKLYHALLINGKDVNNKLYKYDIKNDNVCLFHHSRSNLMFLLKELEKFCNENNYSWKNVQILGALQYLGISSLYQDFQEGKYGEFLFLYGKYLLSKLI